MSQIVQNQESWFFAYTKKTAGARQTLLLLHSGSRLYNTLSSKLSSACQMLQKNTKTSLSALRIVSLPAVTNRALRSFFQLFDATHPPSVKKIGVAARDLFRGFSSWGRSGSFLFSSPILKQWGRIANFGNNTCELFLSISDYRLSAAYESISSGGVSQDYSRMSKYHMLRIAKATLSIALALFTAWMLVTPAQLILNVLAIFLTISITLVSIEKDYFKYSIASK